MSKRKIKLTAFLLALVVALAACGNPRPEVQRVVINEPIQLIAVGESIPLTVTVEAIRGADQSVIWSSSNDAIATVDTYGVVTGVARGTVIITATSAFNPRRFASVELLVGPPLSERPPPSFTLTLNPTSVAVQHYQSFPFSATVTPQHGFTGTVRIDIIQVNGEITLVESLNVTSTAPVTTRRSSLIVTSTTPVGTHNITIRASSGSLVREATLVLTVLPTPTFNLSINPTAVTVPREAVGALLNITITPQDGWTGRVMVTKRHQPGFSFAGQWVEITGPNPVTIVNAWVGIDRDVVGAGVRNLTFEASNEARTIIRSAPFVVTLQ